MKDIIPFYKLCEKINIVAPLKALRILFVSPESMQKRFHILHVLHTTLFPEVPSLNFYQ